jgi:hypothetical protein
VQRAERITAPRSIASIPARLATLATYETRAAIGVLDVVGGTHTTLVETRRR